MMNQEMGVGMNSEGIKNHKCLFKIKTMTQTQRFLDFLGIKTL